MSPPAVLWTQSSLKMDWHASAEIQSVIGASMLFSQVSQALTNPSRSGEYVTMGVRFVHRNVVIRTWRLFTANLDATEDPIDSSPSQLGRLVPIDPSGAYTIEACVRMEDSSNSTLREQAIKELQAFEESMKGAIDFRVPDRMALDPRVK